MKYDKPFSESCEQNKDAILAVLIKAFANSKHIIEIGSGTGQHAAYFGKKMPHLHWQSSDVLENHAGINAWINETTLNKTKLNETTLPNIFSPIDLNVSNCAWHELNMYDGVFSANTVHIMHWNNVVDMFAGIEKILLANGIFCLYGPFNYHKNYTSPSNEQFDKWLKSRDPKSGIKDFEALNELAIATHLKLLDDIEMPENNRILLWEKSKTTD